jgi:radical SAM protein with 4Fe4S-binding SPASM domain
MRHKDRWNYLINAPKIAFDIGIRGKYSFSYDLMPLSSEHMPVKKRLNLLMAGLNLLYYRLNPWSMPIHMQIELTNYCNLSCTVCPTGTKALERKPASLDPVLFKRLFDEVSPYLLTVSLWAWGESLLHPRLTEILKAAHDRGVATLVSTNGQNLNDPGVIKALSEYPPTYLIVAIDGTTDETNSKYRVGAKIAPALEGVHKLAEMKKQTGARFPILHLRFIVMKHNEHEMPLLRDFAVKNKFDFLSIRTLSIIDAPDEIHSVMIPEDTQYRAYVYQDRQRVHRQDYTCEQCFIFPSVFADGTVVSCDQDFNASQPYGNMSGGESFRSLWKNRKSRKIRKIIRDKIDTFSFCVNCPFRDRPITTCSIQGFDLREKSVT